MHSDFKSEMEKRTDYELLQLLTVDQDDYLPEARIAAQSEFNKRNLSTDKIELIGRDITQKKADAEKKAKEPLDIGVKIITFIFPIVLTFLLSGFYKAEGYDNKSKQLGTWTMLGFGFYIVIAIMAAIL